ncbi:ABC transporter permease [Streptomyces caniscabiei]|uniref:ABC transporter permease n=1 Tax=Streptomyces caniscabiei TaxID=2746961 RepID=UPI0029B79F49|nr:ABC transporter permease [Streptomyces caniscabiei]MDX2602376.1 ABC transporter permease [Streptomyces caniscabiei]MDX2734232.1 ABC transporter permease [Streptomyces caniscabiei]MDX2781506.1 ABC transporter permease [Streptomyces caniscabiei]
MTTSTGSRTAESQPKPRPEVYPVRVRSGRRAMLALARVEARRLLLNPLVLIALVAYLTLVLWPGGEPEDAYPVLQDFDRETQLGQLVLGLAVMVAVNLAVLRSHRRGTDATFTVLVLPPWRRTVAHVLSALPTVLVGALIVAGQFTAAALKPGAVGHGSVSELLTGPLLILLPATVGVLLGRVARSAFAAPLAVIAFLAVSMVFVADSRSPAWLRGMAPVLFDEGSRPLPSDLLGRPAAAHALYLLALAVLVAAGAVLLSGGRTRAVRATALGALGVVVTAVVLQGTAPSDAVREARVVATRDPAKVQDCERRGTTTYCAFPEFTPWTDEWARVTDRVRALAGAPDASRALTVRQRVAALDGPSGTRETPPAAPGELTATTAWGGERELEFAASVARGLVVGHERYEGVYCDARGVLMVWLAVSATRDGEAMFESTGDNYNTPGVIQAPATAVALRGRELAVVRALFDQPGGEVERKVKASWAELSASGTTTDRAAALLGVTAPAETADDREYQCA